MTNIESIKEDYNIGDAIRIKCSLGIKEGFIVSFSENRIKIKPFEEGRKPISISEENIEDFEEAFPLATSKSIKMNQSEISEIIIPKDTIIEQTNPDVGSESAFIKEYIDIDKVDSQHGVKESVHIKKSASNKPTDFSKDEFIQKQDQPPFVIGYVDLKSVDPMGGVRFKTHKKNPWELALLPQPKLVLPIELDRSLKAYESDSENNELIPATGFVIDILNEYGWIWDQNLETKIWFSLSDICDEQLYNIENMVGIHVSYIKINATKGPKAIGICLPRKVSQLLVIADSLFDDVKTKQKSYDIIELILSFYPENDDAKYIKKQFKSGITKRVKHSVTETINIEVIKNNASLSDNFNKEKNGLTKQDKELSEKSANEYKLAKFYVNQKKHEEALKHYLKAFEYQKSITLIKDISSLYCSLCGKKYIQGHPERVKQAESYREAGKKFLSDYIYLLPKDQSSYNFLESSYYVLQEYEKYIEIVQKIIKTKVPSQKVVFMCKMAVALNALKKKDEAIDLLENVLRIDSENSNAKALLEKTISNELDSESTEVSDNPICNFLQDTLDNYNQFFGVENYIIGDDERLYGDSTYNSIVKQIDNASSDSQKRSLLLLTKIKLDSVRNEGVYDKRDFALYCNDMARVSILKNPNSTNWDVVRFYFNESFSLTADWSSTRRQFIQYLETLIPIKRNNIFSKLPQSEQEARFKEDLHDYITDNNEKYDMDWIDGLMHPSLYNEDISKKIAEEIFRDEKLYFLFCLKTNTDKSQYKDEESFLQNWKSYRDIRYSSERGLINSYLSRTKHSSLVKLNSSMEGLQEETLVSWLFITDKARIKDVYNVLLPKIESFIMSQGYQTKEDNFHDANLQLERIREDIQNNPTKFSYEALLPLLNHFQSLLNEEWTQISLTSKPNVSIILLTSSSYKDNDDVVKLQIAVANDKESSPISKIRLEVEECQSVLSWNFEEKLHNDLLKGGDQPILYHLNLILSPTIKEKAISICVKCIYENTNNDEEYKTQDLSVRLYSEDEYSPFDNPYNAGDTVENRNMFFGRDNFINNLVNVMESSHSKQLIFYGQKRSGKSSVLYWLQKELEAHGAFCARFSMGILRRDLRDVTFFYQILYSITRTLAKIDGSKPTFTIPKIKDFESENPTNPVQTFSAYITKFKDACKNTPGWENKLIVIMIDEFTYIYTGIKEGKVDYTIMQQWKSVIQDPDSSFASVLVGQDVIPYFKEEEYARNVFQMMDDYRLNYLEISDAKDLIEKPIGKERYASGSVEMILQLTACNPYYIQMICSELVSDMNKKKSVIATRADVSEVSQKIIKRLTFEDFDNLISPGDAITIEGITETTTTAVLYRIAKLTETKEYCTLPDIISYYKEDLLDNERKIIEKVVTNLFNREVIEQKAGMYKIKVKLFQQWMLNQSPETASLREQDK